MSREEEGKLLRLYDRRVVERNIKKGLTTRKDYDKHLKALNDTVANIASPEERVEDTSDDDDLDDEDILDEPADDLPKTTS
jgi:hypothetical protein